MQKLDGVELEEALVGLPEWKLSGGKLVRELKFPDFISAMATVNKIAAIAEKAGHHPDIDIRYNVVLLGLVTHDEGGITAADTAMAGRLDEELS